MTWSKEWHYVVFSDEKKFIWRNQTAIVITIMICVKKQHILDRTVGLEVSWIRSVR